MKRGQRHSDSTFEVTSYVSSFELVICLDAGTNISALLRSQRYKDASQGVKYCRFGAS